MQGERMKIAIIIYSNDSETAWNAFRFANTSRSFDNDVNVFLLGKGVEVAMISTLQYDVLEQLRLFQSNGGRIMGCGVCCESRKTEMPFLLEELKCDMGSMKQLYGLVAEADKILTF
jgi:uncharacterized protein involved in oxidation of intracellular sulfur